VPRQRWIYGPPSVEKTLGSLPVVAEFCRRLDLAGTIDRLCPIRSVAKLTHGQVIEALIANRLTSPTPLLRVEDWAREWAVEEVFGAVPETLNDDRIGRALDAIAPELDGIVGSIGAAAIAEFGIDVSRLHWDMTSISLRGAYDDAEAGFVEPGYGKPKDGRKDLKQVQAGLAVTGDGGIPIFHQAYDGRCAEVAQVVDAMESLRRMAGPREFLLVGDSKLVSYKNLSAMDHAGVTFVAPAPKNVVPASVLAGCDKNTAVTVDYLPERRQGRAPVRDGPDHLVCEDTMVLPGPRKADPEVHCRRVFVWSAGNAEAAETNRARKLTRATEDLERVGRGLGSRFYDTTDKVRTKVETIARDRRIKAYLVFTIDVDQDGRPTLDWHFDHDALAAEAALDGWYALLTNLDPDDADAGEVLRRYKGQEVVERRYSDFKGPLAVAPMFLKNNRRIEALVAVICLALLIFCLVEREVRNGIAPAQKMTGIYPENRPMKPTGRLIFAALAGIRLIPATATGPPVIPRPTDTQLRLLELLGTDPRTQR
jgi:transposase